MTRYWQSVPGGAVYESGTQHCDSCVEVQVVPLDAIVIDRSELPEVTVGRLGLSIGGDEGGWDATADPARWRLNALRDLAIAEYLTAHPPVDEAQVEALHGMLVTALDASLPLYEEVARRLIATGRVQVTP